METTGGAYEMPVRAVRISIADNMQISGISAIPSFPLQTANLPLKPKPDTEIRVRTEFGRLCIASVGNAYKK